MQPFSKEGSKMGTRSQVQLQIEEAVKAIDFAKEQLNMAQRQEPQTDMVHFTEAQQNLEQVYQEIDHLLNSVPPEQRDLLQRTRTQVLQTQDQMIRYH
jgi:hypothetical protein